MIFPHLNREFLPGTGAAVLRREGLHGSWRRENASQHAHPDLEFCLVAHGMSRLLMDRELHALRSGSIVWLPPGRKHAFIDYSRDHIMWVVSFRKAFLDDIPIEDALPTEPLVRRLPDHRTAFLATFIEELSACPRGEARSGYEFLFQHAWRATVEAKDNHPGENTHPGVERVLELMLGGELDQPLASLAREAGLSPSALCRLFKAQTGFTLVEYRNRLKVKNFVAVYADGRRYTLSEAAGRVGFGSYAQFYRVFTSVTGMTPREYQRRLV